MFSHKPGRFWTCVALGFNFGLGQVSNARIMDKGTSHNIMTELHMTANEYNLVTAMYYVSITPECYVTSNPKFA